MGIYLDKYFGYMLDVTEEYSKLCDENDDDILFDKYISCKLEQLDDNLKELGFVPYYFERKHREGDIVLIDDGMCGEYSKIVYVKQAEKYCNDESDVSIENEFFKILPIPDDIRNKILSVYEIIFGKPNKDLEIHLMKLNHYH